MYYVYILQFTKSGKFYTGLTSNLQQRIRAHNKKESQITKDLGSFKLKFVALFPKKIIAAKFEKYLKSHSGRAFRNKRLV